MFTRIVQRVNGLIMAQYIQASSWVKTQLLPLVSNLLASITQAYQSVVNLLLRLPQLVQTGLNINLLRASLITVAQSIKAALTSVKASLIQTGSQLLTTVRQTKQAVPTAPLPRKGKPVGITKSARSRSKGNKTAQTPTAPQSTLVGLKSQGLVKLLLQRAKQLLKAKV
jgi:hypothetical protein